MNEQLKTRIVEQPDMHYSILDPFRISELGDMYRTDYTSTVVIIHLYM